MRIWRGWSWHKLAIAIKRKLDVQAKHIPLKTKMKERKRLSLDGSEKSMIPIIKDNVKEFSMSSKERVFSLEEFSAGTGISDLTIFTIDKNLIKERCRSSKKPITTGSQIEVLMAIMRSPMSSDKDISIQSMLSLATTRKILTQFIEDEVAVRVDGLYSTSRPMQENSTQNIIAIEAKVKDWRSGLRQAMRYKEYADYSYLAIYENNIAVCLKNIKFFKQLGIGLIGVKDNGIAIHLHATPSNMTIPENKFLALERFFSIIDERYESFVAWNGLADNNCG